MVIGSLKCSRLQLRMGADVLVVHVNHSGNAMSQWFTDSPQSNYRADCFNASGTGVLQARFGAIAAGGDTPVFKGFFWFQGESDTIPAATRDAYAGRVGGMMTQLASDLGVTNDVPFTLAVIDANQDPFYDDPANTGGRTRADIEALRTVQSALASSPPGSGVDTRGYSRSDVWHLPTSELTRLGTTMADVYLAAFEEPIGSGSSNIDVWGLGYVAGTPAMEKDWFLTADEDPRFLLNGEAPVKLAENIVTQGQVVAVGTVWRTDAAQSAALKTFLNALYDKGALPGDYAAIRINTDATQHGVSAGVRWGGSHRTSPEQRARLSVVLPDVPNRLVNPGFEWGTGGSASSWTASANGSLQKIEFRLWWFQGGTMLSFVTGTALSPTDPVDAYKEYRFSATAPAGVDKVRAMVIFRSGTQESSGGDQAITTGAAWVDDLRLTLLEPEPVRGGTLLPRRLQPRRPDGTPRPMPAARRPCLRQKLSGRRCSNASSYHETATSPRQDTNTLPRSSCRQSSNSLPNSRAAVFRVACDRARQQAESGSGADRGPGYPGYPRHRHGPPSSATLVYQGTRGRARAARSNRDGGDGGIIPAFQ